jgi:type II secretory pathway component PulF
MHGAGISLHHGLSHLADTGEDENMNKICAEICKGVMSGRSLSASMSQFPKVFDKFALTTIKVGETSGKLDVVLRALADHLEWVWKNKAKLKSTLTYPGFSLALCLIMAVLGPSYLLRGQLEMLRDSGVELPTITKAIIFVSDLFHSPVFVLGLCIFTVGAIGILMAALRRPFYRTKIRRFLALIPVVSELIRLSSMSRFTRAFGLLLDTGVGVTEAIPLAYESTDDPILLQEGRLAVSQIMEGGTLSEALCNSRYADNLMRLSLEAGEQTGSVSKCMHWLSRLYTDELETAYDRLTSLLEPALMLFTGICVGVLLVATLMPTVRLLEVI